MNMCARLFTSACLFSVLAAASKVEQELLNRPTCFSSVSACAASAGSLWENHELQSHRTPPLILLEERCQDTDHLVVFIVYNCWV